MADLAITASELLAGAGATVEAGTAGATIVAGDVVYKDATDGKFKLADSDALASAEAKGIALHGALSGQPVKVATKGPVTVGATAAPTVGETYIVSATAGKLAPVGDLIAGKYVTVIGIATSASVIEVDIQASGVARA